MHIFNKPDHCVEMYHNGGAVHGCFWKSFLKHGAKFELKFIARSEHGHEHEHPESQAHEDEDEDEDESDDSSEDDDDMKTKLQELEKEKAKLQGEKAKLQDEIVQKTKQAETKAKELKQTVGRWAKYLSAEECLELGNELLKYGKKENVEPQESDGGKQV